MSTNATVSATTAPKAQEATLMTRTERRTAVKLTLTDPILLTFAVAGVFILSVLVALGGVGVPWLIVDGLIWLVTGTALVIDSHRQARRRVTARKYAHILR